MACGKGNANQPIEDFIVHSPAPVDMAAKMSAIYNELSFKVRKTDENSFWPCSNTFLIRNIG
jgi:hypothetical protein